MVNENSPTVSLTKQGGRWHVRAYFGVDRLSRKPVRRSHVLEATDRAEAEAEAARWVESVKGVPIEGDAAEAVAAWLDAREAKGAPAGTVSKYRGVYRRHILPSLKGVPLAEVNAADLELLELSLLRGGRGRPALSTSTVRTVHFVLKGAFDWAVKMGRLDRSPALSVEPPRLTPSRARALDPADLARLAPVLEAALDGEGAGTTRAAARVAAWLMLRAGLRCGEACGLTVGDVHARGDAPYLTVSGTAQDAPGGAVRVPRAKTEGSIRSVSLAKADSERLRAYLEARGGGYDPRHPVVTAKGAIASPAYISRLFRKDADRLGLPPWVHPHTLRHTYASIALAAGVDVYTLAKTLGHASPSTTLNTYAHEMPGRASEAASALADALDRTTAEGRALAAESAGGERWQGLPIEN